ncbi:response regulator receiver protein [Candidatus Koribacter versatilis Ellin345]|uniref:Response regulator receiver protein n=1 Tax=Koribacter versatilis (strain Ellin345) TaxID=204669 RepID=Q1INS0_KORVE|nr:response regulator [Candidatus Koribacter versatilis]ABF41480.1 response regulator receiver protein [Candidatus Koribacter versatilis Ellin345]
MPNSMHVLAVDDNRIHSYALEKTLSNIGFQVKAVHTGQDALCELRSKRYDAVLLDVNLPEMNGFEICSAIRSDGKIQQPAIVFHSATHASEATFATAREVGGDAFLTYPIETEALKAVLTRAIESRRSTDGKPMLSCWKDIARFFNKGVRTVQRWEAMGMPVHRPQRDKNIVFADPEELRRWAYSNLREHKQKSQSAGNSSSTS